MEWNENINDEGLLGRYNLCKSKLQQNIRQQLDLSHEITDVQVRDLIDDMIVKSSREYALSFHEKCKLGQEIFDSMRKLDILQEYIDDEEVTEIMVNGAASIFIEKRGEIYQSEKTFSSTQKLEDIIQQIVANCNRAVNEASPIVDARLENGARVNVVLAPVALNGPIVTIRKFPKNPITMDNLVEKNAVSEEAAVFLKQLVEAGYNIFISGGTGSGKTTFLNALSQYIPQTERVITIEDSAELQLLEIPNLVKLEARAAVTSGVSDITMRDLIKTSLRMRPNRIIVGEVRGAEAIDMLQAFNTGHDGSLSTGHANSAKDMLFRLETMVLMGMKLPLDAVRRQIASGIDIIVHLERMRDKSRKVVQIQEVIGYEKGEIKLVSLYERNSGHEFVKVNSLFHTEKLYKAGINYD